MYRKLPRRSTSVERWLSLLKQTPRMSTTVTFGGMAQPITSNLHHNSLFHVPNACVGSIPAWLGSLHKLQKLGLHSNQLSGERAKSQRDNRIQLLRQRPWREISTNAVRARSMAADTRDFCSVGGCVIRTRTHTAVEHEPQWQFDV